VSAAGPSQGARPLEGEGDVARATSLGVASPVASPPVPASSHGGRGFLFLLALMRRQSSLLAHLLASHPEIAGHSE